MTAKRRATASVRTAADLAHSAAIHLLRRAAEADKASGLSAARLSALSVVVFRGPLTLGELAAAQGVRAPTMTGIANGLERDGLVVRQPSASDRRAVVIEATARGREVLQQARGVRIRLIEKRLSTLAPDDIETVTRAARLLEDLFGIPGRPWRPLDEEPAATGAATPRRGSPGRGR